MGSESLEKNVLACEQSRFARWDVAVGSAKGALCVVYARSRSRSSCVQARFFRNCGDGNARANTIGLSASLRMSASSRFSRMPGHRS